jgi:Flp pilus assembly protein TadG
MKPGGTRRVVEVLRALARPLRVRRGSEAGQVLPIFVIMSVVLLGAAAIVTDVAWMWVNQQRMQRAADAGALAGTIFLPGDQTNAFSSAHAETAKNGFTNAVGGVTVTPRRDPEDPRKLLVDVSGPVETFFARVFCWDGGPCLRTVNASATGAAVYVLPVPMGSPLNYYGVFGTLRTPGGGTTTTSTTSGNSGAISPTAATSGTWTATSGTVFEAISTNNLAYARGQSNGAQHFFGFGTNIQTGIPSPTASQTLTITGVEVLLDDTWVTPSCSGSFVEAHLAPDGTTFSTAPSPNTLNDTQPALQSTEPNNSNGLGDYIIGSASSTDAFPIGRSWTRADFGTNFRVRLTARPQCSGAEVRVDHLQVRVHYTLTTSTFIPDVNVTSPTGGSLTPQGFWGTMLSQGAEDINGDAFLPYYETRTSALNPEYNAGPYYNYNVEIPAGASAGQVFIFDPGFCATNSSGEYGTGDRYFGSNRGAMSAFYNLYDTNNTPFTEDDDTLVASSGNMFRQSLGSDATLGGPTGYTGRVDCAWGAVAAPTTLQPNATPQGGSQYHYHNRWWRLATGLQGGRKYRLKTSSTDPSNATDQLGTNGHNSFAILSTATGGTPRISGNGTMQNFSPLNGGGASVFYLAQIDAVHKGKTMVIELWDPGDTGNLSANLQILRPTTSGYSAATLNWRSARGTTNSSASNCNSLTGVGATSIQTNTGTGGLGAQVFNGCWVTIEIPIPANYSAPTPPGETEGGWWKIRYNMGGLTSDNSFDLTTYQVSIRGNPVHLVLE